MSAEEFAANASGRRNKCTAYWLIGLKALAGGDRAAARTAFDRAVATHSFLRYGCRWSGYFLHRMDADPKWPGWVK